MHRFCSPLEFLFTVDPEGPDTVMAPLGEGHTAEMKDGEILVDGEKVYMQANDMKTFFNDPASFVPKICPPMRKLLLF